MTPDDTMLRTRPHLRSRMPPTKPRVSRIVLMKIELKLSIHS